MESSLIIFLIWLALAFIGIVASVKKKNRAADQARRQEFDSEMEHRLRETQPEPVTEPVFEKPAEPDFSKEGQSAELKVQQDPAPMASKKQELNLDPVDMVIYSEIMEPGYEKY